MGDKILPTPALKNPLRASRTASFTVVEVMMATLILMVGFIGLIEAVTVTTNTMEHARRQTLATQIIDHEIEELYVSSYNAETSTWYSSNWAKISALPTTSTTVAIDCQFWPTWVSGTEYKVNRVVGYNAAYYRCIQANTGQLPTSTAYWTAVTTSLTTDVVFANGATFTLARTLTNPDPVTNIREANFTVTWVVNTSRRDASGNRVSFTYARSNSAWYGKYGLPLSYRQS